MLASFLLVNFNMKGLIEQCIKSIILQATEGIECEILIADSSNNPEFAMNKELSARYKNVRIFRLQNNKGWVNALNFLFPNAKGELIFIIHPDIEFKEGCVNKIKLFFDSHPTAGIISPNMEYPDGSSNKIRLKFPTVRTESKRIINIITQIVFKRIFLNWGDEILWDRKEDSETDLVMSICLVVKKEVLERIKQISENLNMYYSNDYLCMKAKSMNYKVFYIKDAFIIHYERFSNQKLYSTTKDLSYKKTSLPIIDKMEKDKFVFLRYLYPNPKLYMFKLISSVEYFIHALSSIKQTKNILNENTDRYLKTIGNIWSV